MFKSAATPLLTRFVLFSLPLLIIAVSWHLSANPALISIPGMSTGITIDLLLLLPLTWLLICSKTRIPKITVLPVTVISLTLASFIIPDDQQESLTFFKTYLLPVLELGVIAFIIYKTTRGIAQINKGIKSNPDAYGVIREICEGYSDSKRVAAVFSTEIAMFYYALGSWKSFQVNQQRYSAYRESGIIAIMAGILLILLVETIWLHKYLLTVNTTLAWVIFALSCYSAVQIFAHLKALRSRGHTLEKTGISLRYGLFAEAFIPYDCIRSIAMTSENPEERDHKKMALLGEMEPHNMKIILNDPVVIRKLYGLQTKATAIYFQCDEGQRFIEHLREMQVGFKPE